MSSLPLNWRLPGNSGLLLASAKGSYTTNLATGTPTPTPTITPSPTPTPTVTPTPTTTPRPAPTPRSRPTPRPRPTPRYGRRSINIKVTEISSNYAERNARMNNKRPLTTVVTTAMKITRFKLPLFILSLTGVCGLVLSIHNGDAGSRLASNLSNKITAGSSSGQWVWQNPLPQGNTLQDFSFIDTNNGFAVGARGKSSEQRTEETIGISLQAIRTTIFMAFLLLIQIPEQL